MDSALTSGGSQVLLVFLNGVVFLGLSCSSVFCHLTLCLLRLLDVLEAGAICRRYESGTCPIKNYVRTPFPGRPQESPLAWPGC